MSRDAFRHPHEPTPATRAPSARIIESAQVLRRFGYRGLSDPLHPEFPGVNRKYVRPALLTCSTAPTSAGPSIS